MKSNKSGETSGADHLIERQMLFLAVRQRIAKELPVTHADFPFRFVTVSRDRGSNGDAIAQDLAKRLRWKVYDREIVDYIAKDVHARQSLVQQLDERSRSLVEDTVQRLFGMPEGSTLGVESYREALLRTLVSLGSRGQAILIGRGANFILREQPGLHVRIVASSEVRIQRLCERWKLDRREAAQRMRQEDDDRRAFIHHHFKKDLDDPHFYDLVFNTDCLSIEQVVSTTLMAMGLPPEGFQGTHNP